MEYAERLPQRQSQETPFTGGNIRKLIEPIIDKYGNYESLFPRGEGYGPTGWGISGQYRIIFHHNGNGLRHRITDSHSPLARHIESFYKAKAEYALGRMDGETFAKGLLRLLYRGSKQHHKFLELNLEDNPCDGFLKDRVDVLNILSAAYYGTLWRETPKEVRDSAKAIWTDYKKNSLKYIMKPWKFHMLEKILDLDPEKIYLAQIGLPATPAITVGHTRPGNFSGMIEVDSFDWI